MFIKFTDIRIQAEELCIPLQPLVEDKHKDV